MNKNKIKNIPNDPFRKIGAKDIVCDKKSKLTVKKIKSISRKKIIILSLMPIIISLIIINAIFDYSIWDTKNMAILRWLLFFGGLVALVTMGSFFDNRIKEDLTPINIAIFPRYVFFFLPFIFFGFAIFKGFLYLYITIFTLGLIGAGCEPYIRSHLPSKLAFPFNKMTEYSSKNILIRSLKESSTAVWFMFQLQMTALRSVLYFFLTVFVILGVAGYLEIRRVKHWMKMNFIAQKIPSPQLKEIQPPKHAASTSEDNINTNKKIRVAHLSDLHFMGHNAEVGLEGVTRNNDTQNFLKKNSATLCSVDVIAVTGDITDTGFLDEWCVADHAFSMIGNPARSANAKPKFAIAPGNHDINIFITFDNSVATLQGKEMQLSNFAVPQYGDRDIRLIRYMAFFDKWSACISMINVDSNKKISVRDYLGNTTTKNLLNNFADKINQNEVTPIEVQRKFDRLFPSTIKIDEKAIVYTLDSNARTWHIALNSLGEFGLSQLFRLWKMLAEHPKGHAAIFLLHHHIKPGNSEKEYNNKKSEKWYKLFAEPFMSTVDASFFKFIIKYHLKQSSFVLHGHTHFERHYKFGRHSVICAPSSGYGEESGEQKSNLAYIYDFDIDEAGNLNLEKTTALT